MALPSAATSDICTLVSNGSGFLFFFDIDYIFSIFRAIIGLYTDDVCSIVVQKYKIISNNVYVVRAKKSLSQFFRSSCLSLIPKM